MRVAYFNGDFIPEHEVCISLEDRAFKYGDMVFDTARTFHGVPFKLERHIERLVASLQYMRIDPNYTPDEFVALSLEVLARNSHNLDEYGDYWLRQYVSRGLDAPSHQVRDAGSPTVLIRCEPLDLTVVRSLHKNGVRLETPRVAKVPETCLDARAKISNYANLIIGDLEVHRGTAALLLDTDGFVAEGFGWNIFTVKRGIVQTPALGCILPGISRETVLELCGALGIESEETRLTLEDLYAADEAFITSTSFCIAPVVAINDVEICRPGGGDVTQKLTKKWCELVGMNFVEQAERAPDRGDRTGVV